MKKTVTLKINEKKTYELGYNLRQLTRAERLLGHSIISLFSGNLADILARATIDFTVNMLIAGLDVSEDEAYEIIDEFCVDNSIDELNGIIISSIMATGLFTKTPKATTGETQDEAKAEAPKKKKK